jgi:simple sugar transport system ATP-binding protein
VRAGEIVAIAGVEGNGQRELASALIGIANPDRGRIVLNGQEITHLPVRARRELGMAFVPEDRVDLGLVLNATVTENAVLGPAYRRSPVSSGWMMN